MDEANETVIVTLSSPSNATLGSDDAHTYTITDNDNAPVVDFNTTSSSGAESTSSTALTVDLSAASSKNVTVIMLLPELQQDLVPITLSQWNTHH
ncbi:MAG: hypothetical protein CM15mP127_04120 [Gammaproteobacteria bacterium]|nr:MAG: hypothetical protein CM15mP127_04120 [Gammaproteobacteria bacterium]